MIHHPLTRVRNNDRVIFDDDARAATLFARLRDAILTSATAGVPAA